MRTLFSAAFAVCLAVLPSVAFADPSPSAASDVAVQVARSDLKDPFAPASSEKRVQVEEPVLVDPFAPTAEKTPAKRAESFETDKRDLIDAF